MEFILFLIGLFVIIFIIGHFVGKSNEKNQPKTVTIYEFVLQKLQNENEQLKQDLQKQTEEFTQRETEMVKNIEARENKLYSAKKQIEEELQRRRDNLIKDVKENEKQLLQEKSKSQKWLAGMMTDFLTIPIEEEILELEKSRSKAKHEYAIKLTDCKKQIKQLSDRNKILEYEIKYLYELYPELEDAEIELDDNTETEPLEGTGWLTRQEWESLSDRERNELAFERYNKRHKTKWQIGRDFEMYIGYKCEQLKYKVDYHGIKNGLKDLGIDLIAKKDNETLIIQCKYWSTEKKIHEKHLCQLYGTAIKYQLEHQNEKIIPVFVCHNQLSDIAKNFANKLGIEVHEHVELKEYPAIKCCFNSGIYHLPFDLSYDQTQDCIKVMTVAEAEKLGYRRSYKFHGYNNILNNP